MSFHTLIDRDPDLTLDGRGFEAHGQYFDSCFDAICKAIAITLSRDGVGDRILFVNMNNRN